MQVLIVAHDVIFDIYMYNCFNQQIQLIHKECPMKEHNNISDVFKQRKQLIWNSQFNGGTAAIFSQTNKKLKYFSAL